MRSRSFDNGISWAAVLSALRGQRGSVPRLAGRLLFRYFRQLHWTPFCNALDWSAAGAPVMLSRCRLVRPPDDKITGELGGQPSSKLVPTASVKQTGRPALSNWRNNFFTAITLSTSPFQTYLSLSHKPCCPGPASF